MMVDAGDDFSFFGIGVGRDGEVWALDWGLDGFRGWRAREWDGWWVDESDGRGGELGSYGVCGDGGLDIVEGGVGLDGGRHVEVVWRCW